MFMFTENTLLNIISQIYLIKHKKHLGKEFVNKYDIEKCHQINKTDFKIQAWACSEHMLKVKPIPYVDESKNVYIIYIIDD